MENNNRKLVLGSILIFLGLVFLFEQFGLLTTLGISAGFVLNLAWPLILIYFGYRIYSNNGSFWGVFLMVVGGISLMESFFDINFWSIVWPLGIMALGIFLLLKKDEGFGDRVNTSAESSELDEIREDVVFWGIDNVVTSKAFKGGEVNCIFGGGKLDLSKSKISKDGAELEVNCVFGGLEVILPKDCKVVSDGTGVFGGWNVKTKESKTGPTLRITGSAVFGGVEVKRS